MKKNVPFRFTSLIEKQHRAALLLAVVALLSFVPGLFSIPAVDRDEARYAQATRQMVANGDFIDIRLQQKPRYKQPIGIYWAQSAFVSVLGSEGTAPIWVHRLPSLIGAALAVLLTYWVAIPLVGSAAAFLSALAMAGSIILGVEARLAKTDAALLATVLLAQGVLARAYLASRDVSFVGIRRWGYPLLFWTALAAGMLIKGPLILLFIGLTVVSLVVVERSAVFLKKLRPGLGILWFVALALPWYVAIGFVTDGAFYEKAIGFSVVGKISQGHEGHGAPPLTHLAWFWGIFWPGSILFALGLVSIWRRRREPWLIFLWCWVAPAWIAFELIATKLPHYLLPVFPAIAIASAGVLSSRATIVQSRFGSLATRLLLMVVALFGIVAIVGISWFAAGQVVSADVLVTAVIGLLTVGIVLHFQFKALGTNNVAGFYAALIAGMVGFFWLTYPRIADIQSLWPGPSLAKAVETNKKCDHPKLVSAGYAEPSLVFNTRTDIVLTTAINAALIVSSEECWIAMIEESQRSEFVDRAAQLGVGAKQIDTVSGFNFGGGHRLDIAIFSPE